MDKWQLYGRPSVKFLGGLLLLWFLCFWEREWLVTLLVAWLCHELGHLLTAAALGWPLVAGMRLCCPCLWQEALIILAGPGVNLLLFFLLPGRWGFAQLFLAGANLLPVLPLDGGRLLRLVLSRRFSWCNISKWLCLCGFIFSLGLISLGGGWFFLGFLLGCLVLGERQHCCEE